MAKSGDVLEMPELGGTVTFIRSAAETGGALVEVEVSGRSRGFLTQAHVHRHQTERFEVVAGRMRFRVGLRTVHAGPGDVVEVAPGVMHAFANDGDEEARLRVEVRPALRMEEMFAEVVAMAEAGRMTRRGLPRNLLDLATLARRYDQEAHAPFLSVGVQRMLLAPLVLSARHPRAGLAATAALGLGLLG